MPPTGIGPDDFAPHLREAMRQRAFSNRHLARELGVSANTVTSWVKGHHLPTHEHMIGISNALQVGLDELAGSPPPQLHSDPLINTLTDPRLEPALRTLAEITPDLLTVLAEARRRSG